LLLLLLELTCPTKGAPRKPWYVPGAAARVGAEGLRRAWAGFYGPEDFPALRTVRAHLGELEAALAIVSSPGDWLPVRRDPEHPERRPRYPNTYHVLLTDEAALWWEREGLELARQHPEAENNPDAWRRLFKGWRDRAARMTREPMLPFGEALDREHACEPVQVRGRVEDPAQQRLSAAAIAQAAREHRDEPLALLSALRSAGVHVHGSRVQVSLASEPARLAGAAQELARALQRGDRVRNRAGWLVRAFKFSTPSHTPGKCTWKA
jgi:hypothetical protein